MRLTNLQHGELPETGKWYYQIYAGRAYNTIFGWTLSFGIRKWRVVGDYGRLDGPKDDVFARDFRLDITPMNGRTYEVWLPWPRFSSSKKNFERPTSR